MPRISRVPQPSILASPVNILIWLPSIFSPTTKTKRLKSHRLKRDIPRQNKQVSPRNLLTILLFDWPKKSPRLVNIHVVRPTIQRSKPLLSSTGTTPTIANPIGTSAMPRHPNKLRTVMSKIGGPPLLRIRHQSPQVVLQSLIIEFAKLLLVGEFRTERIRLS